jgi:hypothetical protein
MKPCLTHHQNPAGAWQGSSTHAARAGEEEGELGEIFEEKLKRMTAD